jgi:hypothetical protein
MPNASQRITAADAVLHPWIANNEALSGEHMDRVQLNLQHSTEKRKFRRAVSKIIAAQKIARIIKHPHQISGPKRKRAAPKTAEEGGEGSKTADNEGGCQCLVQ